MRVHRSRPTSSVPSQCPGNPGALSRLNTEPCAGSCAVTSGAAIDMSTMAHRIRMTPTVTLSRYTRRRTFPQYACPTSAGAARSSGTASAIVVSVATGLSYRRIRGSTAACSTSTAILMSTKSAAMVRMVADSTGTSRRKMARFMSPPEPGQLNTVSTRMDPPSR